MKWLKNPAPFFACAGILILLSLLIPGEDPLSIIGTAVGAFGFFLASIAKLLLRKVFATVSGLSLVSLAPWVLGLKTIFYVINTTASILFLFGILWHAYDWIRSRGSTELSS